MGRNYQDREEREKNKEDDDEGGVKSRKFGLSDWNDESQEEREHRFLVS